VLEVLDARFIKETRNLELEREVIAAGKKLVFVGGNRGTEAGQAGSGPGQTEVPLSPRRTWSTSSHPDTSSAEENHRYPG